MVNEFRPPVQIQRRDRKSIFLAGTIDMGNSEDWQKQVIQYFSNKNIDIYNPRRDSWDSSWTQEYENPQFYQQVMWELTALEKANIIILNFLPDSTSPISLMELGLFADSKKILVCCPSKFYRSGNVHIVCDKYNIPLFENLEELLKHLENAI